MATFTKEFLSGSTFGRPIKIAAIVDPGTLIHTADPTAKDELYLYLVNTSAADVVCTVQFGGTTSPDDHVVVKVGDQKGLVLVIPGVALSNGLVVRVFAAVANVINAVGWVNRITP